MRKNMLGFWPACLLIKSKLILQDRISRLYFKRNLTYIRLISSVHKYILSRFIKKYTTFYLPSFGDSYLLLEEDCVFDIQYNKLFFCNLKEKRNVDCRTHMTEKIVAK